MKNSAPFLYLCSSAKTEYGKTEVFLKSQTLADIAGFYRAFGLDVNDLSRDRVDFIGTELEFMHWLEMKENHARQGGDESKAEICSDAARKFMKDHLGRWASFLGGQMAQSSSHPFYRRVGECLSHLTKEECRRLGVTPEGVRGWTREALRPFDPAQGRLRSGQG